MAVAKANRTFITELERERLRKVETELWNYDLRDLYRAWLSENTGGDNAYHGVQHLAVVALHAQRLGAKVFKHGKIIPSLFLAGLYHDYNHTGDPEVPDHVNVQRAVTAWREHAREHGAEQLLEPVTSLIIATEHSAKPESVAETIIREADYAYELEEDREQWYRALTTELGRPITAESSREFFKTLQFRFLELKLD